MKLDTTTEFGARAERRLQHDLIIWLTTVSPAGAPQPSPVWFLWNGETVLIYSQPGTPKLRNVQSHPTVALHLDGNGQGGDVVILTGPARIVTDVPPANLIAEYVTKYRTAIARIGMSPETFARAYSVAIRVTPTRLRGH